MSCDDGAPDAPGEVLSRHDPRYQAVIEGLAEKSGTVFFGPPSCELIDKVREKRA